MAPLFIALIAVVALAYVAAPLRRPETPHDDADTSELEEQKLRALRGILDLEDERDIGKLSEEDFVELRRVYEAEALDALHQIDAGAETPSDPLEEEIARVRREISSPRCANCGAPRRSATGPCPRCGD
jgi:hypothetical protein